MHTVTVKKKVPVRYLRADMSVRYWEDGSVNGEPDNDGNLIPLRKDNRWVIVVDLDTGKIEGWPGGVTANVHYKVCDNGLYSLLDAGRAEVTGAADYVPSMLAPGGNGYGDYVILDIGPDGQIKGWKADLAYFEPQDSEEW